MHVVVLAYGPDQLTKQAVRRAAKLVGNGERVIAVAASPVAVEAVTSLPGADTIAGFGSEALRDALEQMPPGPTLLVHDDIVITTKGVLALERAVIDGSTFAIPYSNDPNMDNFIGSLPANKAAEKLLDQVPVPAESVPARTIRPTCVAAAATDLLSMLTDPVVDPYASISSPAYTITVAANAVAAHSTTCIHQLVENPAADGPLLVASLIVRNEEETLADCLASLQGVCDRIEVCDTGSTDRTIEIARAAGAIVSQEPWNDDFGAARNAVLDRCRDAQYALVIDADERLVCANPEHTRRYLATYAIEHLAFILDVTNVDSGGDQRYTFKSVRVFHTTGTEYRGALHEVVYLTDADRPLDGHRFGQMRIDHHGYTVEMVQDRNKIERNLTIAEAQHEANHDAHSAIHLARSLAQAEQDPERAIELLEQGLEDAQTTLTASQIKSLLADRYLALGDAAAAFTLAHEALQLLPGDDTALAFLSRASSELGNPQEYVDIVEALGNGDETHQVISAIGNRRIFRDYLTGAYAELGHAEKAVTTAFELLDDDPQALSRWPELISCLNEHYGGASLELLVPLAVKDATGGFLEPIIKTYPSGTVADFCALYVGRGGALHEATRIGLLAAAMSSNEPAFARLAPAAHKLDANARIKLAARVAESGRPDLAARLSVERAAG